MRKRTVVLGALNTEAAIFAWMAIELIARRAEPIPGTLAAILATGIAVGAEAIRRDTKCKTNTNIATGKK